MNPDRSGRGTPGSDGLIASSKPSMTPIAPYGEGLFDVAQRRSDGQDSSRNLHAALYDPAQPLRQLRLSGETGWTSVPFGGDGEQAMKRSGLVAVLAAALATLSLTATAARADWLKAESERFIVYSEGSERSLRDYVQKLETFDRVMRYRSGLPMDQAPLRKLPIYIIQLPISLL